MDQVRQSSKTALFVVQKALTSGKFIRMKRIFDTRSKSAETLVMGSDVASFAVALEPQCKKQRQSVIKQSVKRLFGSVKRLLPTSHRRKDKVGLEEATTIFFSKPEEVKKSAAMQEAEAFIARLGPDWTLDQVNDRIAYLYRLVNDAFERAYQQTLQDKTILGPSQNANDYMIEIRRLQAMISERQTIEATAQFTSHVSKEQLSYSADNIGIIPTPRSCSVDNVQQTQAIQTQFDFVAATPACTRPFSPAPPVSFQLKDFEDGVEFFGFPNLVDYGIFYTLSQSRANVPPLEKSGSITGINLDSENQGPGYVEQYEAVFGVQPEGSEDEEMEIFDGFEEKIQLFERISKSGVCSIGSIGHERQHPNLSLPNLSRPRSFEQSQEYLPSNHAHHQSLGSIPMGNTATIMPRIPAQGESVDCYVADQSDCSSRRCSVRELAKMFENTTI